MKLTKGSDLSYAQRAAVLRAYVHRYTGEHRPQWAMRADCAQYAPTHSTDAAWVDDHAFYIRNDGELATTPRHCEPAFLAN